MPAAILPEDLKIREYEVGIESRTTEVAELEIELETELAEHAQFQALYLARVGSLFLYDDVLTAALAREKARRAPDDADAAAEATKAEELMKAAQEEADRTQAEPVADISPELKAQYRNAIRTIHPDLAADDEDRAYRTEMTQKLNEAYRRGDEETVQAIMRDFQLAEMPDNAGKRLIVLIRQEHDLGKRVEELW